MALCNFEKNPRKNLALGLRTLYFEDAGLNLAVKPLVRFGKPNSYKIYIYNTRKGVGQVFQTMRSGLKKKKKLKAVSISFFSNRLQGVRIPDETVPFECLI